MLCLCKGLGMFHVDRNVFFTLNEANQTMLIKYIATISTIWKPQETRGTIYKIFVFDRKYGIRRRSYKLIYCCCSSGLTLSESFKDSLTPSKLKLFLHNQRFSFLKNCDVSQFWSKIAQISISQWILKTDLASSNLESIIDQICRFSNIFKDSLYLKKLTNFSIRGVKRSVKMWTTNF